MRRTIGVLTLGCLLCCPPAYAAGTFYLQSTLDLSWDFAEPLFGNETPYGTNPAAVTTDGESIWVAGFNGGSGSSAGIVKISDPWGTPAASFVASYATPGSRGFSGLAYDPNAGVVLSAYDNGGANPNGVEGFDPVTNANMWSKNARGGSGVGDDPGYGGVDMGAGWATFGAGRRALQDSTTGADIYTTGDGMVTFVDGTWWRDMDFNAATGDIWLREGNDVQAGIRTGGNACSASLVVDLTDAPYVNGQNIAYLDGAIGGDLVVYNDRYTSAGGQFWAFVTKVINPDGTAATVEFVDAAGDPLGLSFAEGAAFYDYEWYAPTQELIVSDFSNRLVYRFSYVPEPASLTLLALGGVVALRRRR